MTTELEACFPSKKISFVFLAVNASLGPSHSIDYSGFLRNSRKYGLGSLRKTLTEGIPPTSLGPILRQSALPPTPPPPPP